MTLSSGQITGLFAALNQAGKLTVADYQRNYAWDVGAVETLFDDILELLDGEDSSHFMGSLILHKDDIATAVVDGQQRLTTIFILAAIVRDRLTELTDTVIPSTPTSRRIDVLGEIEDFLYIGDSLEPRFEGNYLIRSLFVQHILAQPQGRPALKRRGESVSLPLRKATWKLAELLQAQLDHLADEQAKLHFLYQLVTVIKVRLKVLVIQSTKLEESLEVFMTLNDRGVPLGPSDIVRGLLLINMASVLDGERQRAKHFEVLQEWEGVLSLLDGGNPDQYLRHYLLSTGNMKVQKKAIAERVRERVQAADQQDRARKSTEFWIDLCEKAQTYSKLLNPPATAGMGYYLASLKSLADSYRVLMLTVLSEEAGDDDPDLLEIARLSQALTLRWLIAGKNAQELESFYQECSSTYRMTRKAGAVIEALKSKFAFPFDSDALIARGSVSDLYVKVILHGIDQVLKKNANIVHWGTTHLELEHVAPQTPKGDWAVDLVGAEGDSGEYSEIIDRIGNKTILDPGINRAVKQDPFDSKKQGYVTSQLIVTRDLALVNGWDKAVIDDRGQWIAEMFEYIWSPERATAEVVAFSEWRESH